MVVWDETKHRSEEMGRLVDVGLENVGGGDGVLDTVGVSGKGSRHGEQMREDGRTGSQWPT